MIYSGSIVFIEPDKLEEVTNILADFSEIEVHGASEDKKQLVVSIETESDEQLEELSRKIKSFEQILDIGHHVMHFEDEVDKILQGRKIPDLKGFQRSRRREKNPLEEV